MIVSILHPRNNACFMRELVCEHVVNLCAARCLYAHVLYATWLAPSLLLTSHIFLLDIQLVRILSAHGNK
eukprot:2158505-Pleurochrysis_carterae.AAC.1